jgi:histidine ammonia-lyase
LQASFESKIFGMLLSHKADLTLSDIEKVLNGESVEIDKDTLRLIEESHQFLVSFAKDKIIYGINTGFGPMAQYRVDDDKLTDLQYNLIRSHAAGAGVNISDLYIRVIMLVRLKTLLQGKSGIHVSCSKLLETLINEEVYPNIPEHGGVGASGDLVQLAHLALGLIGEGEVSYKGKNSKTKDVFKKIGVKPIEVKMREGLALINGTSVMTGIGLINIIKAKQLLNWSLIASAMLNEIVNSFDDHFSNALNDVKKHEGQSRVAYLFRNILEDSKLIARRDDYFYADKENGSTFVKKVQEYYSLRCVPQILGPILDTIDFAEKIVLEEANSVSDNPIIDVETKNVYHGGNFHGDYVSLEMDKLKMAITKLTMLSERQLNFIFNSKINEILPPFVNMGKLGLNLGMQGTQFTATSTTAESQTLSNPMYVHSIPTNNDNQDIVSMGTNAALMTKKVIENAYHVLSIQLISLAQAIDILKVSDKLSTKTAKVYNEVRTIVPKFIEDTAKHKDIDNVTTYMKRSNIELN